MSILSIGKAWDEANSFLRREARLVTPVALATFTAPATLFGWYNPSGDPNLASGGLGWPLTLVVLIIAMTGQMVIAALAIGWSGSVGTAFRHAFKRVWGVLATVFLVFIPLTLALVLVLGLTLGGAGITDPSQISAEALAGIPGVGWVLLITVVIFLYVAVRLFPISAIAVNETSSPIRLLSRCWQLTRGHFFRLLGTLLLILVASLLASMAVTFVIGSTMAVLAGEPEPYNLSALVVALADGLISAAITAVSAALVGRVYVQLSAGQASVPDVSRKE